MASVHQNTMLGVGIGLARLNARLIRLIHALLEQTNFSISSEPPTLWGIDMSYVPHFPISQPYSIVILIFPINLIWSILGHRSLGIGGSYSSALSDMI